MEPEFKQVQPFKIPCIECLKYFKKFQVIPVIQDIPCTVEGCRCNILHTCRACWFKYEYWVFMSETARIYNAFPA